MRTVREKWGIFLFNFSGMPTTKGKHFDFPLTIRWRTTKQCWCFFPFESNVKSLRFWVTRSGHTQKLTINSLPVHWSLCLLCCWTRKDEKQIWLLVDVWFFPRAFFNSCGWWKPGKDKNISNQPTKQPTNQPINQSTEKPKWSTYFGSQEEKVYICRPVAARLHTLQVFSFSFSPLCLLLFSQLWDGWSAKFFCLVYQVNES